jgi:hypothetical protein
MTGLTAELDRLLLESLKEVHNRGADLYNAGDSAGAFRLYQGALMLTYNLLSYRPAIQHFLHEGLTEVMEATGTWHLRAFRLHEVIDQVRQELKNEFRKRDGAQTDRVPELTPVPVEGVVYAAGVAVPGVIVMLTAPGDSIVSAVAVTGRQGEFRLTVLPGEYHVTLQGPSVPVTYLDVSTTPLRLTASGERVETVIEYAM